MSLNLKHCILFFMHMDTDYN